MITPTRRALFGGGRNCCGGESERMSIIYGKSYPGGSASLRLFEAYE